MMLCISLRAHRGPGQVENFKWYASITAPGFAEPTRPGRFPPSGMVRHTVGAAISRPPFSAAQLEPHRNKGAFNQGSAMLPTTAQSAAAKDEEKVVS